MTSFALITEGITDQVVLEIIIQTFYSDKLENEVDIRFLQPIRDATDESRQGEFGGWEKVLEHCSYSDRILEALALNDYIVIQIDTDCCEEKNFGLCRTLDGVEKPANELIPEVKELIASKITSEIFEKHQGRFLFAIAVHSIECWLLPLHASGKSDKSRTLSCEKHLRRALDQRNKIKYEKTYDAYEAIASDYTKIKKLEEHRTCNQSFSIFLDSLPCI
jgi:hypothetical protein